MIRWCGILFASVSIVACSPDANERGELPYLNLHDSVTYVGSELCRSCHASVYDDFMHTGMGLSFDLATRDKSAAVFDEHTVVYDSVSNFWYKPFWKDDSLFISEYRLDGRDTIHKRIEYVAYVIGSGQHTNSHLLDVNGYIHQAPITFYTQRNQWDLAPGFDNGFNSRFSRIISMECMSCHNALPEHVPGSENKYEAVPLGISCERCHGPGSLHVQEKMAGNLVDTALRADYTIVNPGKLPTALQTDLCERCHLQGVTVLNSGSQFSDFRPAMKLSDVMHVFLPSADKDQFLMASHADRLRQSACYQTGELSCISCHNPHISVTIDQTVRFNNTCKSCHTQGDDCTESLSIRQLQKDDCNSCHMPKSGSIDIPHVSITDHNIQVPGRPRRDSRTGLLCMTDKNPSALLKARGYLRFYEGFTSNPAYLDSAEFYLDQSDAREEEAISAWAELYYLRGDYQEVVLLLEAEHQVADPYTNFRMGDALLQLERFAESVAWLSKAVDTMPFNLEFLNKLGSAQFQHGDLASARKTFQHIIDENPKDARAHYNLGFTALNQGDQTVGEGALRRCIALDPDYELAYLNLATLYNTIGRSDEAKEVLIRLIANVPESVQGRDMLATVVN